MRRLAGAAGMSLVEATVILAVLALLTSVLAPSIQSYVDDAKRTKAKEDVEAIGVSIARLWKDVGVPFLLVNGAGDFTMANRVDVAFGDGDTPVVASGTNGLSPTANTAGQVGWTDALAPGTRRDSLYRHLVSNEPHYRNPTALMDSSTPGGPSSLGEFGLGWRGAYLPPVIGPDPWGFRYSVNSMFLGAALDASTDGEGKNLRGWSYDTIVISPGPNGQIEVDFAHPDGGTPFTGGVFNDDVVYVIQGFGK